MTTTLASGVFLFPLVFLVVASLRAPGEPLPTGLDVLVPTSDTGAYQRTFEFVDLGRQLLNSGLVALLAVPPVQRRFLSDTRAAGWLER